LYKKAISDDLLFILVVEEEKLDGKIEMKWYLSTLSFDFMKKLLFFRKKFKKLAIFYEFCRVFKKFMKKGHFLKWSVEYSKKFFGKGHF